jgi:uncharacterized protein with HEPN domain
MLHRRKKLLADIAGACTAIERFTADVAREAYSADSLRRSAVERQFGILGEALRRLELYDEAMADRITDYWRFIEFRNVLVHGYDSADDDMVWQAVTEKIPALKAQAQALLAELTAPAPSTSISKPK